VLLLLEGASTRQAWRRCLETMRPARDPRPVRFAVERSTMNSLSR